MSGDASDLTDAGLTVPYRVRFDEAAPGRGARASALLAYAQDVAWIHSERLGFDRAWYAARGLTWLVRAVELAVVAPIEAGAELAVTTTVVGYRRAMARRRTTFVPPDRASAAWALTDWVIVDGEGRPTRVPEDFPRRLGRVPPFEPIRIGSLQPVARTAAGEPVATAVAVRPRDLDPIGHVNNAVYLDYLEEAVAELTGGPDRLAALPRTYRLEYLLPAEPGPLLTGRVWPLAPGPDPDSDPTIAYRLSADDGRELVRGTLAG